MKERDCSMKKMTNIAIFQAPFASMIDCGAWARIHSDKMDGKEIVPKEYYMPVFRGEIQLPDDFPETGDNLTSSILEHVFEKFNLDHPTGYCGRSLSVGDVVVLDGKSYLCKPVSFQECSFVSSDDPVIYKPKIAPQMIKNAEQVLIDNGIEPDEAQVVLQAVGYALLDEELYPEDNSNKNL